MTAKSVTLDEIPAGASREERRKIQARNRKRKQRQGITPPSSSYLKRGQSNSGKAPAPQDVEIASTAQITIASPQGQMTSSFDKKDFRKVDAGFYEILREGIPVVDAGIRRLISLNGTIRVIGDKMDLVKDLEDFCLNVPVNDMQKGIHAFLENASNETFEQGFSISEFVATKDAKDIDRLVVADSKRIVFRKNTQGRYEPWYRTGEPKSASYTMPGSVIQQILTTSYGQTVNFNGVEETRLKPENKIYLSINNENSDPYGVSVLRSLDFVAQTLVTIQNAMKNTAERFGDPSYHLHYKGKSNDTNLKTRRDQLQTDFNATITAKRAGKSADLVTAGGPDSEVKIEVIGHQGQVLTFDIPLRHLLEQIVSKFNLPAWMLGIYWSTTERMATLEIEAALADARIRQYAMTPEFIRLCAAFLRLRGRSWKSVTTSPDKPGDWGIVFETPNLRDLVAQAQAKFLSAQADQMVAWAQPAQPAAAPKSRKDPHHLPLAKGEKERGCTCGQKELRRPTPWPELDKVEADYEKTLKDRWAELRDRVVTILKLTAKNYELSAGKEDLPGLEAFTFTEEQRAQIMDALKNWTGPFDPAKFEDSPVRWYYGQSYSLGLIQAAKLIGKQRPILDIIKNKEIYDTLCRTGFTRLKDDATRAIVNDLLPEMQAQMLAGTNPRHVAARLESIFDGANSDWERLTRSEMSMAAEKAKLDEWEEWDVDTTNTPVPVKDTHPRCRCSTAVEERGGKSVAVFVPAPDACALCFSVAG